MPRPALSSRRGDTLLAVVVLFACCCLFCHSARETTIDVKELEKDYACANQKSKLPEGFSLGADDNTLIFDPSQINANGNINTLVGILAFDGDKKQNFTVDIWNYDQMFGEENGMETVKDDNGATTYSCQQYFSDQSIFKGCNYGEEKINCAPNRKCNSTFTGECKSPMAKVIKAKVKEVVDFFTINLLWAQSAIYKHQPCKWKITFNNVRVLIEKSTSGSSDIPFEECLQLSSTTTTSSHPSTTTLSPTTTMNPTTTTASQPTNLSPITTTASQSTTMSPTATTTASQPTTLSQTTTTTLHSKTLGPTTTTSSQPTTTTLSPSTTMNPNPTTITASQPVPINGTTIIGTSSSNPTYSSKMPSTGNTSENTTPTPKGLDSLDFGICVTKWPFILVFAFMGILLFAVLVFMVLIWMRACPAESDDDIASSKSSTVKANSAKPKHEVRMSSDGAPLLPEEKTWISMPSEPTPEPDSLTPTPPVIVDDVTTRDDLAYKPAAGQQQQMPDQSAVGEAPASAPYTYQELAEAEEQQKKQKEEAQRYDKASAGKEMMKTAEEKKKSTAEGPQTPPPEMTYEQLMGEDPDKQQNKAGTVSRSRQFGIEVPDTIEGEPSTRSDKGGNTEEDNLYEMF